MQRLDWHCHTKSVSGALYKAILCHGQSAGKKWQTVLSSIFGGTHAGCDWISLTEVRREFHARTPITNGGTTSVVVEADHIIQINITQHRIANF